MANKNIQETGKRLGVCLNDYSDNSRLLEEAVVIAERDRCPWFAIYIDDDRYTLDSLSRERLRLSIDKARVAGAEIIRLPSSDVVQGIITAAEFNLLTHIIVGKRRKSRISSLLQPTLASKLLKHDTAFELQVITLNEDNIEHSRIMTPKSWRGYAVSTGLILVLTAIIEVIQESLPEYRFNASIYNVSMVYLLVIVFAALRYGLWPAIVAATLSFGFYNYFFITPFYEFGLNQLSDILNFTLFLSASLISLTIADTYKRKMISLNERELAARALHDLTRETSNTSTIKELTENLGLHLQEILQSDVVILLENGKLKPAFPQAWNDEQTSALKAYQEQQIVDKNNWRFYPISTPRKHIGVLGVSLNEQHNSDKLIEALSYQAALAVERCHLMQESQDIKLQHQRESLRSSLLSAVSHDLKTPLVSIIGSLSSIRHMDESLSREERRELISTAIEEAERLNQSISNILHMTKIESGDMKANKVWLDVHSLFSDASARLSSLLGNRSVQIEVPNNTLAVSVDPVLFPQILQNLLENIAKYTPEDCAVILSAKTHGKQIELHISDNGSGIAEHERERLFDKFTRLESRDARIAGTGLGLSICKAMVELHAGDIALADNPEGRGLSVIITLQEYRMIEHEIEA